MEKLRKETKDYVASDDPEFLAKYSEKKWNHLFENNIYGKVNDLINNLLYIK
jgi:hypothetical protein